MRYGGVSRMTRAGGRVCAGVSCAVAGKEDEDEDGLGDRIDYEIHHAHSEIVESVFTVHVVKLLRLFSLY